MAKGFKQFDLEARCEISRRLSAGESCRQIAAALGRSSSSVSREVARNGGAGGYKPAPAQEKSQAKRWKGSRLERDATLQARVLDLLKAGLSPEQVCGRLAIEAGRRLISHESIYRFVEAQIRRTKDYSWRHFLPRGKSKRGRRGRRGGSAALLMRERVSIHDRPAEVESRDVPGHWEADLMLFSRYGQAVLAVHERSTRFTVVIRQTGKFAAGVSESIRALLAPLPAGLRRSITFDNGTEFALHYTLRGPLSLQTYFCDPHSPWQKGGIENAIGRLRRGLPRRTDLAATPNERIEDVVRAYNHTPRKCLGYLTPAEAFFRVMHFKCESTFPLSRE